MERELFKSIKKSENLSFNIYRETFSYLNPFIIGDIFMVNPIKERYDFDIAKEATVVDINKAINDYKDYCINTNDVNQIIYPLYITNEEFTKNAKENSNLIGYISVDLCKYKSYKNDRNKFSNYDMVNIAEIVDEYLHTLSEYIKGDLFYLNIDTQDSSETIIENATLKAIDKYLTDYKWI